MVNLFIAFFICVLGCITIGVLWFGNLGGFIGLIIGLYLFNKFRKRNRTNLDYERIGKMMDERLGPRK